MKIAIDRALALVIALLLSACGGGGSNKPAATSLSAASSLASTISSINTSTAPDTASSSQTSSSHLSSQVFVSSISSQPSHLSSSSLNIFSSSVLSGSSSSSHSTSTTSLSSSPDLKISSSSTSSFSFSNASTSSSSLSSSSSTSSASSTTSANPIEENLQTWWHGNYEENATTPVANDKVRRSTIYDVSVSTSANPSRQSDSFVYMSIPRGGKDKPANSRDDGAEFATQAKLTMSWSSFLYKADTWVQINVKDGKTINSLDEVRIRPTTLDFKKELLSPTSLRIKVPFNEKGYRFSVEIAAELMTSHSTQLGVGGKLSENPKDAIVHTEPRNALLIFAEPMLSSAQQTALVPTAASGTIFYPAEGEINLHQVSEQIIYFKPGIYSMPANDHARLPANVRWVYLAPGAYVKGGFEFSTGNSEYKLTGFGVISGEKYVYAPIKTRGYVQAEGNCDDHCLRLLQFVSADNPQTLQLHGITLNEPPFNSFSVLGNTHTFQTHVSHYKQVGSWYYQTDGVEVYTGGSLTNAFFHSNDDVLKMYHSNTRAENIVIWKGENGPAIQFGWASRNISNILVKDIDVIHNRMYWKHHVDNTCIINSMDLYREDPLKEDEISLSHSIKNVEFRNIRSEGKNLCAMRFIALSNWESIYINGLDIEDWNDLATNSQLSLFRARSTPGDNPQQVAIGTGSAGLRIENYKVAGQVVQSTDDSWKSNSHGRLNFSVNLFNNWVATSSEPASCIAHTINFAKPTDTLVATTTQLAATTSSNLAVNFSILAGDGSVAGNTLSASQHRGLVTVAAEAGNENYCHTRVVQTLSVFDPNLAPVEGRWVGASWASWSPGNIPMTWDTAEKLYKATVTLAAGNVKFKFSDTINWGGDDWGNASSATGTAKKTTGGGADISISIANAGNYIIRFNPYSLAYSVTAN